MTLTVTPSVESPLAESCFKALKKLFAGEEVCDVRTGLPISIDEVRYVLRGYPRPVRGGGYRFESYRHALPYHEGRAGWSCLCGALIVSSPHRSAPSQNAIVTGAA